MIKIKRRKIDQLPILEIFEEEKEHEVLPTVLFFHGWTNCKEDVIREGYELAMRGFRAILPDAHLHGERDKSGTMAGLEKPTAFWDVVIKNVKELPAIYTFYVAKGLTDPDRFGVTGLSMGGITTCAALVKYDWINTAVVLMGSPSPILFTKWVLESSWMDNFEDDRSFNPLSMLYIKTRLKGISLNEYPEKIAGRPVHFWHGTVDELVPHNLTEEFIEEIKDKEYAKQVSFHSDEGIGHMVPHRISVEMAEFFNHHL